MSSSTTVDAGGGRPRVAIHDNGKSKVEKTEVKAEVKETFVDREVKVEKTNEPISRTGLQPPSTHKPLSARNLKIIDQAKDPSLDAVRSLDASERFQGVYREKNGGRSFDGNLIVDAYLSLHKPEKVAKSMEHPISASEAVDGLMGLVAGLTNAKNGIEQLGSATLGGLNGVPEKIDDVTRFCLLLITELNKSGVQHDNVVKENEDEIRKKKKEAIEIAHDNIKKIKEGGEDIVEKVNESARRIEDRLRVNNDKSTELEKKTFPKKDKSERETRKSGGLRDKFKRVRDEIKKVRETTWNKDVKKKGALKVLRPPIDKGDIVQDHAGRICEKTTSGNKQLLDGQLVSDGDKFEKYNKEKNTLVPCEEYAANNEYPSEGDESELDSISTESGGERRDSDRLTFDQKKSLRRS